MPRGSYPADGLDIFGGDAAHLRPGDMEQICQPPDFVGLNIYHGKFVRAVPSGTPRGPLPPGYPKTTQDLALTPPSLYWGPRFCFYQRYGVPIVITENGHQNADVISLDGHVHDRTRIDYLQRHLRELRRAVQDGVDVRGYFQWVLHR